LQNAFGSYSLVFKRASIALDRVVSRLEPSPGIWQLTDSALQSINTDLDAFKNWLSVDKFALAFWEEIRPDMESLKTDIADGDIPDVLPNDRQFVENLKSPRGGPIDHGVR
jgi:hypothetical protein